MQGRSTLLRHSGTTKPEEFWFNEHGLSKNNPARTMGRIGLKVRPCTVVFWRFLFNEKSWASGESFSYWYQPYSLHNRPLRAWTTEAKLEALGIANTVHAPVRNVAATAERPDGGCHGVSPAFRLSMWLDSVEHLPGGKGTVTLTLFPAWIPRCKSGPVPKPSPVAAHPSPRRRTRYGVTGRITRQRTGIGRRCLTLRPAAAAFSLQFGSRKCSKVIAPRGW